MGTGGNHVFVAPLFNRSSPFGQLNKLLSDYHMWHDIYRIEWLKVPVKRNGWSESESQSGRREPS